MKPDFEVDISEFEKAVKALGLKSDDVRDPLKAGYLVFEGQAKTLIQTSPASGRQYGKHKASAPGEPPASDTGNLAGDWPAAKLDIGRNSASIEGGPGAEYAIHLEYGTEHMAARPFIRPAAEDNKEKIWRTVKNGLVRKIEAKVK